MLLVVNLPVSGLSSEGEVLLARSSDAHAWLEYWNPDSGWNVFDPTPRIFLYENPWTDFFLDSYDWLETAWYRYFLSYTSLQETILTLNGIKQLSSIEQGKNLAWKLLPVTTIQGMLQVIVISFLLLGFALIVIYGFLLIRAPIAGNQFSFSSIRLRRERVRMEKWIRRRAQKSSSTSNDRHWQTLSDTAKTVKINWGSEAEIRFLQWVEVYQRCRFYQMENRSFHRLYVIFKEFVQICRNSNLN